MDEASSRPGLRVQVREVQPGTAGFELVLALAARVLAQDRYLVSRFSHARESHVLGAFDRTRCVGFLRYLIQVIGAEAGRPPVLRNGQPLSEGYRVLPDAVPQPGDKRRELCPEDRRRVRVASQSRERLLLFPAPPLTGGGRDGSVWCAARLVIV
jgi:hypothetical protein